MSDSPASIAAVLSGAARYHVEAADCFDFAARIPDGAVNLLWLDGPYNMGKAEWDTFATVADMLAFYDRVFAEAARVLAPNGSLYVCTSTAMGARMECKIAERFAVLNNIRWAKPAGSTKAEMFDKEICRAFFPSSETIVFAEHAVNALTRRVNAEMQDHGLSSSDVWNGLRRKNRNAETGIVRFWMRGERLIQEPDFCDLLRVCGDRRTDSEIGDEYRSLRRPFSVSSSVPYVDTWTYSTVPTQTGKHPCEKPPAMLRDVIAASSRPGDVVCELFAGSGVGGEQAILQGRRYLGCDADPEWARRTIARIDRAEREPHATGKPVKVATVSAAQGRLL